MLVAGPCMLYSCTCIQPWGATFVSIYGAHTSRSPTSVGNKAVNEFIKALLDTKAGQRCSNKRINPYHILNLVRKITRGCTHEITCKIFRLVDPHVFFKKINLKITGFTL